MTDREHALLVRIQLLSYRLDHYHFTPPGLRRQWLDELAQLSAQLKLLRQTQS